MMMRTLSLFFVIFFLAVQCDAHFDIYGSGSNGVWSTLSPLGTPPEGKDWHSGACVGEGLFVAGGADKTHNDTFYYDTDTNSWKDTGVDLPSNYKAADMAALGGKIFLFGGKGGDDYLSDLFMYNIHDENGWLEVKVPMKPGIRNGHSMTQVAGLAYIFGGWNEKQYLNDLWMFDTNDIGPNGQCSSTGSPPCMWLSLSGDGSTGMVPHPRNSHSMVSYGGNLVIFGGFYHDVETSGPWVDCSKDEHGCVFFNDIWTVDLPVTKTNYPTHTITWAKINPKGNLPTPRYGHSANMIGNSMYIFGGIGAKGSMNDLWVLSLEENIWVELRPTSGNTPSPRYSHVACVIAGSIYLYGGIGGEKDLFRYDPAPNAQVMIAQKKLQPVTTPNDLQVPTSIKLWLAATFFMTMGILACFLLHRREFRIMNGASPYSLALNNV